MQGAEYAELSTEELEVIQELEDTLSHIKGRHISLVAFDLGEAESEEEEFDEASFVLPYDFDDDDDDYEDD